MQKRKPAKRGVAKSHAECSAGSSGGAERSESDGAIKDMIKIKERYQTEVVPQLKKQFAYKNDLQVPRLEKVVVNMGLGEATASAKAIDGGVKDLVTVTGQKPIVNRARKSIATFKVRKGMPVGASVTLRGRRMYDFMAKLIHIALPRIRDFRGLSSKSFDGRGNYSVGIKEQLIFPEINYEQIDAVRGMDIAIVTTARTDQEGQALLAALGFPFKRN
jgi:large subunit ribosomal protein L5